MDSKFAFTQPPGKPLLAVSPERANRQNLPPSPSVPSELARLRDPFASSHTRTSSDVQIKVAQFNNLSKEAIQRRRDNEAALKRAIMGREEAESETNRLKEESRLLKMELEEGRVKERKVCERLEELRVCEYGVNVDYTDNNPQGELHRTKETNSHSQALYEREVRRARKEAFRSSSMLLKAQEELKSARNKYTLMREQAEEQGRKIEEQAQKTFSTRYQLVSIQEEIKTLAQQKTIIEEERDALKRSLKVEELARIAAEGQIALPASKKGDEFASPAKKTRNFRRESFKENMDPSVSASQEQITALRHEIYIEKKTRQKAEDQIHFMKMECQFRCCSCRVAEHQGVEYIHEDLMSIEAISTTPHVGPSSKEDEADPFFEPTTARPVRSPFQDQELEPLIKFSPTTGTFHKTPSPLKQLTSYKFPNSPRTPIISPPDSPTHGPSTPCPLSRKGSATQPIPTASTPFPIRPLPTPLFGANTVAQTHAIKTVTTFIPLVTTPAPTKQLPFNPEATMTREQALEQIRARRGRARSIATGQGTPRRLMEVSVDRRDISAPAGKLPR